MAHTRQMRRWISQILTELRNQYTSLRDPSIIELNECGPNTVATLLELIKAISAAAPASATPELQGREIAPLRSPRTSSSASASPRGSSKDLAPSMSLSEAEARITELQETSHAQMNSVHHTRVTRASRRLFTDASLLLVVAKLQRESTGGGSDDGFYKSLVGELDNVLVLAGAPGLGRSDMVHDAIARIQEDYLPLTDPSRPSTLLRSSGAPEESYPEAFEDIVVSADLRQSKRPKRATRGMAGGSTNGGGSGPPLPLTSTRNVQRHVDVPSVTRFRTEMFASPFIIQGYASDWPAVSRWSNPQYLRSVGGLGRRVPVETTIGLGQDYTSQQWTTRMMEWEGFIDGLTEQASFTTKANQRATAAPTTTTFPVRPSTPADYSSQPKRRGRPPGSKAVSHSGSVIPMEEWNGESNYLAQHDLINQFPELRSDIIIPDYVYADVSAPPWFPEYRPPGVDDMMMINNWIGPKGTITPAHKDPYYNCYVQVVGRKTIWLAPPDFDEEMYPYDTSMNETRRPQSSASTSHSVTTTGSSTTSSPASRSPSTTSDVFTSTRGVNSNGGSHAHAKPVSPFDILFNHNHLPSPPNSTARSVNGGMATTSPMLGNTSRVPVFDPPSEARAQYPVFFTTVVPKAFSAVLEPGDMLVFPPGWWHAMRSEETSASVSMWF